VTGSRATEMLDAVAAQGLLDAGRPVLVMISGGRDSVCLLDLAVRIAGAPQVLALHVNYGLREAAAQDEALCRSLCDALAVGLEVRRPAQARAGNLHGWARAERYRAARELAGPGRDVAAGHTATDQVETILYRLASSPSRRALLGMAPREHGVIRPLLGFTREHTAAYCRERGLAWREDESNDALTYARARVRHTLVPALREIHPGAERNVLALAERLRDEAAVLDAMVAEVLAGAHDVSLARLAQLPPALSALVVQRLADEAAGGPAPGVGRRAPELLTLPGRSELHVGSGLRAVCERGRLHFAPLTDRAAGPG
jgi:tRNA(Ile)-lysidine synthase